MGRAPTTDLSFLRVKTITLEELRVDGFLDTPFKRPNWFVSRQYNLVYRSNVMK